MSFRFSSLMTMLAASLMMGAPALAQHHGGGHGGGSFGGGGGGGMHHGGSFGGGGGMNHGGSIGGGRHQSGCFGGSSIPSSGIHHSGSIGTRSSQGFGGGVQSFSGGHQSSGSSFGSRLGSGGTSSRGISGGNIHSPQSSTFLQQHFSGRHSGISQGLPSGNLHQSFRQSSNGNLSGLSHGFHQSSGGHHGWNSQQWNSTWNNHLNNWGNRSYFFGYSSPFIGYFNYPRYFGSSYGIGLSFGYGYPSYYGNGYGYPGYGSYGYGGYGYGSSLFAYQPVCSYYAYAPTTTTVVTQQPTVAAQQAPPPQPTAGTTPTVADAKDGAPSPEALADALNFASQGEQAFRNGQYEAAARDWQHAIVDDPMNGAYVLLMSQAMFATGQYEQAAGAVQHATRILPEDQWGVIGSHYRELYAHIGDYTNQLRALEKARDENPDKPALRFLLGWHYGYLGYPKDAVRELDKGLSLAPKDEVAKKVRDIMAAKLKPATNAALTAAPEPASTENSPASGTSTSANSAEKKVPAETETPASKDAPATPVESKSTPDAPPPPADDAAALKVPAT